MFRRIVALALLGALLGIVVAQPTPSMVGVLGVGHLDFRDGSHAIEFTLHTLDGVDVPLEIPPHVMEAAGGLSAVEHKTIEVLLAPPTRDGRIVAAGLYPVVNGPRWYDVNPSGTINWSFVLCKFNDKDNTPLTLAQVQTMTGATEYGLATYWSETTHGVTTTNTSTASWKTLDNTQGHYLGMGDGAARSALLSECAAKNGVSTSGSRNIAVVLNARMFGGGDYAYGGYSYSGGQLQRTIYLPGWAIQNHNIIAHEQGHSYGMPHSDNMDGDANPYDNPWDVMSDSFYQFYVLPYGYISTPTNVYYYHQLGILPNNLRYTLANNSTATIVIEDWMTDSVPNGHYRAAFIPITGTNINNSYAIEVHRGTTGGFNSGYRPNPSEAPTDAVIIYRVAYDNNQNGRASEAGRRHQRYNVLQYGIGMDARRNI